MQARLFKRYVWLVNTIASAGEITMEAINERWADSFVNDFHEACYPRRTFFRHKEEIEEIFGIEIGYSRSTQTYHLSRSEGFQTEQLRQWMMNNFALNNAIAESQSLRNRIQFEKIPEGTQFIPTIITAMQNNRKVSITHQRFGTEGHTIMLDPYCLKVFKQRWYVYGRPSDYPKERRIYALDRITQVQETDEYFAVPKDFNAEEEFAAYYGVFTIGQPELVRVRVINKGADFLRTLPLHHSQEEVVHTDEYSEFEYYLAPTFDFLQQLKTFGDELIVLQPQSLREQMQKEVENMLHQYQTNEFIRRQ